MLADYHVHTSFSDDSAYPLRQVALDAVRLNLDEICFTEHVDYGVKPEWNQPEGPASRTVARSPTARTSRTSSSASRPRRSDGTTPS